MNHIDFQMDCNIKCKRNLGTFSTTSMPEAAQDIFQRYACINAVDNFAYPQIGKMTDLCGEFLLKMFHADPKSVYQYFPTSGSSEAIFLSILLLKNQWIKQAGQTQIKPNLILTKSSHIAFISAAKALDVELQFIAGEPNLAGWQLDSLFAAINSGTIGVVCTLGAPTTLVVDDIEKVQSVVQKAQLHINHFLPIHVDAASGGFVVPFAFPDYRWDFRLDHVKSINVSSHKFGLVYPSLGWLCIKEDIFDLSLTHENTYLGKSFRRLPLQFSHSASHVATQAYHFTTLGWSGYEAITKDLYNKSHKLKQAVKQISQIEVMAPDRLHALPGMILLAEKNRLYELSEYLAKKGWHLPVFQMEDSYAARIVIRYGFDDNLLDALIEQLNFFCSCSP